MYFNSPISRFLRLFPCKQYKVCYTPVKHLSYDFDSKYTDVQKQKILKVINEGDIHEMGRYDITKNRIKKINQWRTTNGKANSLSEVELIESFTEKTAKKLFDSILNGKPKTMENINNKIKGQILQPNLPQTVLQKCQTVLAVYVTASSVCWTLIRRNGYELLEWRYHGIDQPDGKKLSLTDILETAWEVTNMLPHADIYVMKAEATTLRAAGSDPNNPKVIAVNLQKAQLVAMMVSLINSRSIEDNRDPHKMDTASNSFVHKVYFLRPSLPFRLYGTLVGNERVSTDQTIEMLFQEDSNESQVQIPDKLKTMFSCKKDLEKDMLGHALLLGLTFMDLCVYKDQDRVSKLLRNNV